jgi:ribosome recycling factor
MNYDFNIFKENLGEVKNWLSRELSGIRTGRATATLLDSVRVESYGVPTPLNQVAGVNLEDARTIRITPYDLGQVQDVEKGINDADLGVSTSVDEKGLRIFFPELTSERRELLVKQVGKKLEDARVSVRKERDDVWNDIQAKEKAGELSEDDKFRAKDEMQKIVDQMQKELEELTKTKETEIRS